MAIGAAVMAAAAMLGASANAKIIEWHCTYPIVANPNGVIRGQDFRMLFALDDATGKATSIHNSVKTDMTVVAGERVITFLERSPSGTIQTTAIDVDGHSVHSRHMMAGRILVPSQSYGSCVQK
jgi:hypothetical protein